MSQRYLISACLLVLALLQAGCGQKGDLYLPAIPAAPNVLSDSRSESAGSLDAKQSPTSSADAEQEKATKRAGQATPEPNELSDNP